MGLSSITFSKIEDISEISDTGDQKLSNSELRGRAYLNTISS